MKPMRLIFLAGLGAAALSAAFVAGIFAAAEALEISYESVEADGV